ncbi:hypothetical protein [Sphingomonas sp. HITSZ_GF]|uniref:hypothetical protein n=1 Tax=Sphingomonas sp. HITSZ_GF TaxID=3037247 RepID=UPI00240D8906|nr:hypothetical protein [Sphingomonas sp. HITSZ_GF]
MRLSQLRTDGMAGGALPATIDSHGKAVALELYDMVRLNRVLGEGQTRADIDVDLVALAGHRIACLPVASGAGHYEAFLAAFPGETLSRIYDRYGIDPCRSRSVASVLPASAYDRRSTILETGIFARQWRSEDHTGPFERGTALAGHLRRPRMKAAIAIACG